MDFIIFATFFIGLCAILYELNRLRQQADDNVNLLSQTLDSLRERLRDAEEERAELKRLIDAIIRHIA